jgi:phosphoribosylamine---glycine ligase
MNILLLGSGGREHALAWKLRQSKLCSRLLVAPGNAGTAQYGENVNIAVTDFDQLKKLCITEFIEVVIVGPEEPLVKGIFDYFKNDVELEKITVVGPSAKAAQLEGSKAFSKQFMQRHNIPTAAYAKFTEDNYNQGKTYIQQHALPVVLKADGLAAGKGVVIAQTHEDALNSFEDMIINKQFGEASSKVVIEEFLQGIEVSVFVVTDGKHYKIIGHAKDYKRIGEGDSGLNTGGMGCITPVPFVDDAFMRKVEEKIIQPTIDGIAKESLEYNGFIFFGLMNVQGEPFVIEYNCRLGDPETEVILPRLQNDLMEVIAAIRIHELESLEIKYDEGYVATVVAVSGGYPGDYKKGIEILGIPQTQTDETIVFHSGTKKEDDKIVTNGGRVLAVTSYGDTIAEAVNKSKALLSTINYEGKYFRGDIGFEFVDQNIN